MNGHTETKPTSTERVNRHRRGLKSDLLEIRHDLGEIRRALALLTETVRTPEPQQNPRHGR
jgi:hypothetical protein